MPEDNDDPKTRRSVLKSVGAATAAGMFVGTVGTVAADDASTEGSWYEYKCERETCQYGGNETQYRRHCFEDPEAGNVCGSWEEYGCC